MQAQHLRAMCNVTRTQAWEERISTQALGQRLGIQSVDMYVARRQARWLGHVSRMPFERLPRRMLSAWVPHRRPAGAPSMTYGRSVFKALDKFGLDVARWPELAADRSVWRAMLQTGLAPAGFRPGAPAPTPPPRPPSPPPLARTKQTRRCAAATNAAIDSTLRLERRPLSEVTNIH
jgi:hypothetical protein